MECFLVTVGIAISLYSDEPRSIAFEDCGKTELRVTYMDTNKEVKVLDYLEDSGIYIIKEGK